ncbi:hypothetical protein AGMMS50256_36140 [Betaproteobacteria bacterium]|nr:hypothetical protein AGMMS50256_36140 [Betaproteobacteria bacterium]
MAQTPSQWGVLPDTTVNSTQINFGGHEWVVIGNENKDIYKNEIAGGTVISSGTYGGAQQPEKSVTLLSIKNDFAGGNNVEFRASSGGTCAGINYGTCNNYPNEYNGSSLQSQMMGAVPSGKEQGVINPRTLAPVTQTFTSASSQLLGADGMTGAEAQTQWYWALSLPEWEAIASSSGDDNTNGVAVRSYPSSWWLRSPRSNNTLHAFAGGSGGGDDVHLNSVIDAVFVVRPAFNLDLTSVLFTSESSAAGGKSGATAGGAYTPMATPSAAQKFTFLDKTISARNSP